MSSALEADVVAIGMGPGGEDVAGRLAEAGLDVVGIDRELVGGECPHRGCVPSKMMIRGAHLLAEARRIPGMAGDVTVVPTGRRSQPRRAKLVSIATCIVTDSQRHASPQARRPLRHPRGGSHDRVRRPGPAAGEPPVAATRAAETTRYHVGPSVAAHTGAETFGAVFHPT